MKYTRNALGLLNAQYRSVLKKCFLINMGLFALGAGVSTADAAVTLSPTLDSLKTEAQKTGKAYPLTELKDGETVPEGQAAVKIGGSVYYFKPNAGENAKFLSILAGTSAASLDNAANPTKISFNANNIPASVFSYVEVEDPENGYNFVVQEADQDGNITKKYYKIDWETDKIKIGTSEAIKWKTESTGATGSVEVKLPNSDNPTKLYYTVTESKYDKVKENEGDRLTDLTGDVGSATKKVLFKGLKQTSDSYVQGGAINNSLNGNYNIYADFIGNYASSTVDFAYGGAIYNGGTIGNITGDFIDNYASSSSDSSFSAQGGAIYNGGTIGNITGDFIGNYAATENGEANGGAIYNDGTIDNITGDFIGNYASVSSYSSYAYGGAIYNFRTINNITGDFIGNYASSSAGAYGGAIYNKGTLGNITGDFIGNYTYSEGGYAFGGAIYNNEYGTIDNITGNFIGNYASSYYSSYYFVFGGAIYNEGTIGNITGDFIGNYASFLPQGGAIFNRGTIDNITGNFIGNYASSSTSYGPRAKGGAIYNNGTIGNIAGNFIGNYASSYSSYVSSSYAQGGAIYNDRTLTIAGASTFTDNYVEVNGKKTSNAIHNNASTYDYYDKNAIINFNSGNIVINDGITGVNYSSTIKAIFNFAGQITATADNDVITLNNSITNNNITKGNIEVNLKQGTLKLGHYDSALFNTKFVGTLGEGVDFNVSGDSTLSLADDAIHPVHLGDMTLNSDLKFGIDVDLANNSTDTFTTDSINANSHNIILNHINLTAENGRHISEFNIDNMSGLLKLDKDIKVTSGTKVNNTYLAEVINDNTIKFGNTKALETAVQFKKADKNFNMTNVADINVDLGKLVGPKLTINGNNNVINGNNKKGMTIAGGQTVSLNDVSVKGFDGAFAENNGTMNIDAGAGNELNLNSGISGSGDINAKGEGKLNINSDIAANKMTVSVGELNLKSGSELANVENFVANGGVLNVGDQTVNLKNAEFNNGSTLAVNVKSDGNGLLKAENLTINGGNLKATLGQGIVEKGSKTVTLLESNNTFTNKFADVMENNMYRFEKADKAGDYIISLTKTAEDVSQENGGTQNNAGEAKAWVDGNKFEQGSVSADVADKLADLAQNDAKGFNEALSALAPSDNSEVRINSINHNTEMFRAVVSHLDDVSKKKQYGLSSGDAVDGVSVWAKAFGNHAKVDNTSKAYGFKSDGYGATLGIEKQLNDAFKVGLGYSYFYNDVDGFMRDSDVNTHTGFVYGEYRPNNWYTNAIASYGYSKYDENKHVAGDVYKAKYDVDNIGAQVMTGYNASVAKVDVTPEAGLRYNNIHRDNYVDSAGQAVKAETMDVMTAVAGLKVGKDLVSCFGLHEVYWRPEARLAATYDLISDKENAVVSLSNGSGYVVKGQRLNRFGVEAGAGVTFYLSPDVESSVGYEGKFRSHYQDHTGYVSAKYKF